MGSVSVGYVLIWIAFAAFYFAPGILAYARRHQQIGVIILLNVLLAWSIIGWIVLLVWSLLGGTKKYKAV